MKEKLQERNYTPIVLTLTVVINLIIAILFFLPKQDRDIPFDLTILPRLNGLFNSFTFIFLLAALFFILRKNIRMHRNFIFAAFTTTTLFLITYLTYHFLAPSTTYGGEGFLKSFYYFILISHILLAPIVVALALFSLVWGLTGQVSKHRKIARWTMPIWLYVSLSGVLVFLLISPYY